MGGNSFTGDFYELLGGHSDIFNGNFAGIYQENDIHAIDIR